MSTIVGVLTLVAFGVLALLVAMFGVSFAGVPGALIAGASGHRSKGRFVVGCIFSVLAQSYLYLAVTGIIVGWTQFALRRDHAIPWLLWPVAFLAVMLPLSITLSSARLSARKAESPEYATPLVVALDLTVVITFIGFLTFAFAPSVMRVGWGWLPYVQG